MAPDRVAKKEESAQKFKRKFFVSNQGSIPVHQLHLFGRSGVSRRKKQKIK
jgi:hypothetical protein